MTANTTSKVVSVTESSSDDGDDEIRVIHSTEQTRFARGWHCLGLAAPFHDGKPHQLKAFGTELVIFADAETDELKILNAYCPHMGGNLSKGKIVGDSVACPFHEWRWRGDGKCSGIPYARRVPARARTKAWTTLERNGQLYVWNDPEGNPPPDDVTIPEIKGAYSPDWSNWTWNSILIEGSHCREMVDNVVDMAHFFYIHFMMPTYFKNVFEGHVATQLATYQPRGDVAFADMDMDWAAETGVFGDATYYGPSYMINAQWNSGGMPEEGQEPDTVLINCHYPVSSTSFVLMWGAITKKQPGMTDAEADAAAAYYIKGMEASFMQDVVIWQDKTKIDNPLLCDEDGPVYQLRRWYDQFYVNSADVKPEMVDRFEFEIDTSRARSFWDDEMKNNIATGNIVGAATTPS